jgi:hypothetical protein
MININYYGGLGNNLFQYFAALILSKKFNQSISNPLLNNIFKFDFNTKSYNNENHLIINDHNILSLLKETNINENIILDGFFQNRVILEFLKFNKHLFTNEGKTKNGSFIHVRLGDISNDERCCKIEYYQKALQGLSGGYISSDSPSHDIIKKLSDEFNLQIFENSPEETIIFGSQFENKILSLGTFSWWIGFLGNQNNVICPVQKEYPEWHGDIFPFLNWKEVSIKNQSICS